MAGYLPKPPFPVLNKNHPLSNGLVAMWPFYEGGNAKSPFVNDIAGRYKSTSATGASFEWRKGPYGYMFYANNSYVICPTITELVSASRFTINVLGKKNSSSSILTVGRKDPSDGNNNLVHFLGYSDGNIYLDISTGVDYGRGSFADPMTTIANYTMVFDGTLTGDANRLKLYKDGVLKTLGFPKAIPATTTSDTAVWSIGRSIADSKDAWFGCVQVYNRALSQQEAALLTHDPFIMCRNYNIAPWLGALPVPTGGPPLGTLSMMGIGR